MRPHRIVLAACIAALVTLPCAAERAPEDRTDATHVAVGKVEAVYERVDKGFRYYLVEIAVEKATKGDGLEAGTTLYARCYRWNGDYYKGNTEAERKRALLSFSSYDGVPKEGDRVRVYLKRQGGKHVGVYHSWYDVLAAK
jgi:hypothetical protein